MTIRSAVIDPGLVGVGTRSFGDYCRSVMVAMHEPWPHKVYYHLARVTYVDPSHYLWSGYEMGPSDCAWIVPGTLECQQ